MNPNDPRNLATALRAAMNEFLPNSDPWNACERAAAYLREQADRQERTEHVAWCRYSTIHEGQTRIVLCDSDASGAFKVYLHPAPQSVPEGYWLAPMEPTQDMCASILNHGFRNMDEFDLECCIKAATSRYRAMRDACIAASPAAPVEVAPVERGPWKADAIGASVRSDDFTHDVQLNISGDFATGEQRKQYADELARRLNAAPAAPAPADVRQLTADEASVMDAALLRSSKLVARGAPADALTVADYEAVIADHHRLVRELDVALNGEEGAAKQASLCDIVAQVKHRKAAPADVVEALQPAARDVLAERLRQVKFEGWTPAHDDEHTNGELAEAAAAYAIASTEANGSLSRASKQFAQTGWAKQWWKPTTPRRDLIKAGALILAEIERLDRAALAAADQQKGEPKCD